MRGCENLDLIQMEARCSIHKNSLENKSVNENSTVWIDCYEGHVLHPKYSFAPFHFMEVTKLSVSGQPMMMSI